MATPLNASPVVCRVPQSLNLERLLDAYHPSFTPFRPDVVYAFSEHWYRTFAKEALCDYRGFVRIKADHLRCIHDDISGYIKWLVSAGVLEVDEYYKVGVKATGYRWSAMVDCLNSACVILQDRRTIKGWQRLRASLMSSYSQNPQMCIKPVEYFEHVMDPFEFRRKRLSEWYGYDVDPSTFKWLCDSYRMWSGSTPTLASSVGRGECTSPIDGESKYTIPDAVSMEATFTWLVRSLEQVTLDPEWKRKCFHLQETGVISPEKYHSAVSTLGDLEESIECSQYLFKVSPRSGRVFTHVTQLPRASRSLLRLAGAKSLVSIDIKCAQPYFLTALARELGADECDVLSFQHAIADDLYKVLGEELGGYQIGLRDSLKKDVLRALYSPNGQTVALKEVMDRRFPDVYRLVHGIKAVQPHGEFAIMLQRLESDFVIKIVCNELRKAGIPVLTVHDSVIVAHEAAQHTVRLMEGAGLWYTGMKPQLTVDWLETGAATAP